MVALEPQAFLAALIKLFEATREKGSVFVTFKKVKKKGEDEVSCLIRAKTTKKKIATTVSSSEAESFNADLGVVLGQYVTPQAKVDPAKTAAKGKGGKGGEKGKKVGSSAVAKGTAPGATAAVATTGGGVGGGGKGGAAGAKGGGGNKPAANGSTAASASSTSGGGGKKKKKGKR